MEDNTTKKDDSPRLLEDLTQEPEPNGAEGPPPEDLVEVTKQTPQKVQDFPGPALHPSPEFAGEAAEPDQQLPEDAKGPVLYVTGASVNFRAGPSTGDRVIGALDQGMAVEALGPTDGTWVNIRDSKGRIGYMSAQFLSSDAP